MTPPTYLPLLTQLDRWQATAQTRHPGVVPCRSGCTACCHGPFDISVADAALVAVAVNQLEPGLRAGVIARAEAQLTAMKRLEPSWSAPYEIAAIGEARFDRLSDELADLPCPALDADGACTIYQHRPFVCRVMGVGMVIESGDVIDNACPIQDRFPAYAALPPEPFHLEAFEVGEDEAKIAAARRLFGDESRFGYETTVAAAIATWGEPGPPPPECLVERPPNPLQSL